jgi:hypothetical protein
MNPQNENTSSDKLPNIDDLPHNLTKEEIAKLTPEQQAAYFARQMLNNLNTKDVGFD